MTYLLVNSELKKDAQKRMTKSSLPIFFEPVPRAEGLDRESFVFVIVEVNVTNKVCVNYKVLLMFHNKL